MKNKFHYWPDLFHSFMKKFLLKIGPKFVRPHITTIFEKFLQTVLFYVNKNASYTLVTIWEPSRIPKKGVFAPQITSK